MQIFSLNVYARIPAQKKLIIMFYGTKRASRHDTQRAIRKSRAWGHFSGQIYILLQKHQPKGISSQNTMLYNFSTERPIFTKVYQSIQPDEQKII
jgi:hypothetical protein